MKNHEDIEVTGCDLSTRYMNQYIYIYMIHFVRFCHDLRPYLVPGLPLNNDMSSDRVETERKSDPSKVRPFIISVSGMPDGQSQ